MIRVEYGGFGLNSVLSGLCQLLGLSGVVVVSMLGLFSSANPILLRLLISLNLINSTNLWM